MTPFPVRVEEWRERLADWDMTGGDLPVSALDQWEAANGDARGRLLANLDRLTAIEPGLYHLAANDDPDHTREVYARVRAALDDVRWCIHLRRGGPQSAFARLACKRVDCRRCVRTAAKPVTGEDECDWCGATGVTVFTPVQTWIGAFLVFADVCDDCAGHIIGDGR